MFLLLCLCRLWSTNYPPCVWILQERSGPHAVSDCFCRSVLGLMLCQIVSAGAFWASCCVRLFLQERSGPHAVSDCFCRSVLGLMLCQIVSAGAFWASCCVRLFLQERSGPHAVSDCFCRSILGLMLCQIVSAGVVAVPAWSLADQV